jgi:threonylcarbamoyladenosine tRNA methylthiotransferase MtaB
MREILLKAGFKDCISKEMADIYIINTCTVTEKTDKESRHWIASLHKTNPKAKIVVTGCYSEKNSDDIAFLPGIAHIIKNEDKSRIAEILQGIAKTRSPKPRSPGTKDGLFITDFKNHTRAFVKIQDGCENSCSYCRVPIVRDTLYSKPIDIIVEEVKGLAIKGFKEIVISGICLGAWGKDIVDPAIAKDAGIEPPDLVDVLKALDGIPIDFRIRLSSIEPKYVTDKLIDFIAGHKRICRHLHVPLQSGDDEILMKMNRGYTTRDYKKLADKIRSKIKDIGITTDILIGFPEESEERFKNTLRFVKELMPSRTHIFTFSKRPGTPACSMPYDISYQTLKKRYYELRSATLGASYIYRKHFVGQTLGVLVETKRDKDSHFLAGYTDNYIKVLFNGADDLMGKIVPVRIEDLNLVYTLGVYEPTG